MDKKAVKNIIGIIGALAVFLIGVKVLNYAYVSPNLENRIMWKSLYSQDEIDTLFLGSSLVFCGIDIDTYEDVMSEHTGEKAFDLSTGSQRLHEAYYNLMEADKKYNVKHVYLEMNSMLETYIWGDYDSALVMSDTWTDTDYMRLSFNKLRALFDINTCEYLIQAFMPFTRYRAYIFDKAHIMETLTIKRSDDYKNYTYVNNYADGNGSHIVKLDQKGYWKTTRILKNPVSIQAQTKDTMTLSDDAGKYLKKIIEYCDKHDIELALFMTPMYPTTVISTEDYDIYHDSVMSIANEYNVPVYDFNLVKEDYLKIEDDEYFDISHLNSKGAEKFTRLFAGMLADKRLNGKDNDMSLTNEKQYDSNDDNAPFHTSYKDKLKSENPKVYGLYFSNKGEFTDMYIAASENDDMEFKVTYRQHYEDSTPGELEEPLQDFCKNRYFEIPSDAHGTFTVYTQMHNNTEAIKPVVCIY